MEKTEPKMSYYVIYPRFILDDLRDGKMTTSEYLVYMFVRHHGDIIGFASISLEDIANGVFDGKKKINTINSILIKLKRKDYIDYEERRGKKGQFRIELDWWIIRGGKTKRLKRLMLDEKETEEAESNQRSSDGNQMWEDIRNSLAQGLSMPQSWEQIRSRHTDTDKEIDKDKENESENSKPFKTVINGV